MAGIRKAATGTLPVVPGYVLPDASTRYISTFHTATTSGTALTAGEIAFVPVVFEEPLDVLSLHITVGVAGTAGALARLGIFDASAANGLPGARVVDGGTVSCETTGRRDLTIATTRLPAGLHWLAVGQEDGSGFPRLTVDASPFSWLPVATASRLWSATHGLIGAYTPGALPASAGAVTLGTNNQVPVFGLGVRRV